MSSHKSFLLTARVKPATLNSYDRALLPFLSFLFSSGFSFDSPLDNIDDLLTDYIHEQFLIGGSRSSVSYVYCGLLLRFPRLRPHLLQSAAALEGWQRLRPSSPYLPLSYDIALLLAVQLTRMHGMRMGVCVLVSFECLLRVGEWGQLKTSDFVDASDVRVGSAYRGAALRLASTKTGTNQFVVVIDPVVRFLLRVLVHVTPRGHRLFPFSASTFRSAFRSAVSSLHLPPFVPHSLRHGGATRLALAGWRVEDIAQRGRWASTTSARHYIQSGKALLLTLSIPPQIATLASTFASAPLLSLLAAASPSPPLH